MKYRVLFVHCISHTESRKWLAQNPHLRHHIGHNPNFTNFGITLLSAILKTRGIGTSLHVIEEGATEYELAAFRNELEVSQADFVAFSVVNEWGLEPVLPFMEVARETGRLVLLGGSYPRLTPFSLQTPAHYVCQGDGETLADFILKGDDRLFRERLTFDDPNQWPLHDYEIFMPWLKAWGAEGTNTHIRFTYPYLSSRGCPWRCPFCLESYRPERKRRIRTRVQQDAQWVFRRYGRMNVRAIYFSDETLPYYSSEWCRSWGDMSFPFQGNIRADIDPKLLKWLCKRGLQAVFLGVESPDEETRNTQFGKRITDSQIVQTLRILSGNGVMAECGFIYGAPGQAENEKELAVSFVKRMKKATGADIYPGFSRFIQPEWYRRTTTSKGGNCA